MSAQPRCRARWPCRSSVAAFNLVADLSHTQAHSVCHMVRDREQRLRSPQVASLLHSKALLRFFRQLQQGHKAQSRCEGGNPAVTGVSSANALTPHPCG